MFESLNFFVPKFSKFLLVSGVTFERAKTSNLAFSIEPTPTPTHRLNANEREKKKKNRALLLLLLFGVFSFSFVSLSLSLDRVSLGEIQKKKKRDF